MIDIISSKTTVPSSLRAKRSNLKIVKA